MHLKRIQFTLHEFKFDLIKILLKDVLYVNQCKLVSF